MASVGFLGAQCSTEGGVPGTPRVEPWACDVLLRSPPILFKLLIANLPCTMGILLGPLLASH